ncbi:hypothetical protein MF672_010830 [Actinomadura sp. ATCC 31491]|uniref:Phage portal protein n=1 Tax=Actinomadura luzonensis TaxID=2805427 RepID=A0ABT0FPR8_9ACTN|nr:hypothetical protein [Actinomadura luzonensis]MCK2214281.1 hypothetical protein [Actinomadura luzonensis]
MGRSIFAPRPPRRAREATPEQLIATGALGGRGYDPVDGESGWTRMGTSLREVPHWTQEKARDASVAAYRSNPMARAVIETYVSFCVGDKGVSFEATNADVREVVEEFWNDPRNRVGDLQELWLRDQMITGETLLELLQGRHSGVVRYNPIEPSLISEVSLLHGNPLWPHEVKVRQADGGDLAYTVVAVDDVTGLRDGEAMFWAPNKTLLSDRRGMPFLMPILDWLDSYDAILSNLIDRTALARYFVWDVTVEGDQGHVDAFVAARGGTHVPPSGSMEVHNQSVKWEAKHAETGAQEDSIAGKSVLTVIAGGAGLAKTWLADPEDSNRATSLTMAEPVRRRVGGLQKTWLAYQTELCRFVVDRAVAAKRLQPEVEATDPKTGESYRIPAAQCVTVVGPEIAAADSELTASVLLNLSTGLEKLVEMGALSREAASVAARKAWEDYVGIPWSADLAAPDAELDDIATAVDDAGPGAGQLIALPGAGGGTP